MDLMMSEKLKQMRPLRERGNNVGETDAPMAYDSWKGITSSSDDMDGGAEVDTLFFGGDAVMFQKSLWLIVRQVQSTMAGGVILQNS